MTTTTKQIMTAERFTQGHTWSEYIALIKANKEGFQQFYDEFQVDPGDAAFFKKFNAAKGLVKMVVIGEDWCPDVVRGVPVAVRVAEAAGMELRIFPRDSHLDLMDEYLWRHEFLSIPVFVFFDKDWKELGHWIERPAAAYKFVADLRQDLAQRKLSEEETLQTIRERRAGVQKEWMGETVRELREQVLTRVM